MLSYQPAMQVREAQRQDWLRTVERERWFKQIRDTQPGLWDRLLTQSGDWLISAGQRLKARRPLSQPA
jgi:hypothetical protein